MVIRTLVYHISRILLAEHNQFITCIVVKDAAIVNGFAGRAGCRYFGLAWV